MKLVKANTNFTHEIFGTLTTITNENNEVYFIGKEVAETLGYARPTEAIQAHVREKHKTELNGEMALSLNLDLGQRGGIIITEAGLYSLVMRSKLPSADVFQDWVTEEVLPAIRKTGSYGTSGSFQIEDSIERAKAWIKEEEERRKLLQTNTNLNTVLDNLREWVSIIKVSQHNKVSETYFSWRKLKEAARLLGLTIKKAESPRYGYQNLYHVDAFRACYPELNYDFENNKMLGYKDQLTIFN